MRPRAALGIAMILLSASAMGDLDRPIHVCSPVVEYSWSDQAKVADKSEILAKRAMIVG